MGSSATGEGLNSFYERISDLLERRDRAVGSLVKSLANTSRRQAFYTLTGGMSVEELEKLAKSLER